MFQKVLPPHIFCLEASEKMWQQTLSPQLENFIVKAVPQRQAEFRAGRNAAAELLQKLNKSTEVLMGLKREPIWPDGVIGSITHCRPQDHIIGKCCVAIVLNDNALHIKSLGIDLELAKPLAENLIDKILTPFEQSHLKIIQAQERNIVLGLLCMIIFSMKEAIYKTLFPLLNEYIDFLDLSIELEIDENLHNTLLVSAKIIAIHEQAPEKLKAMQWKKMHICCFVDTEWIYSAAWI
ncbi:MAG: 4'-phosphopantetheinyl transferase superfamily protein [Pseudomonadota bacterium]